MACEREWMEAIIRKDVEEIEGIVGREYTLTANGFPGKTRFTRDEWMATLPVYDVHSYDLWCSPTSACGRPSGGATGAAAPC